MKTPSLLSQIVFSRTYSAVKENGNKETWDEVCDRYMNHIIKAFPEHFQLIKECVQYVRERKVLGSMRLFQFSGNAAEKEQLRGYNCSYISITEIKDFSDTLYLLSCGVGVGFSVQLRHVNKLPSIDKGNIAEFIIQDSRESWADSVATLIENPMVQFDYSFIRSAGSSLSSGGFASGPEPLRECHELIRSILINAVDRQLTPIEVYSIQCAIGHCIVAGGVRRSALICLFDKNDEQMLQAKSGDWWVKNAHFSRANNSAVLHRVYDTQDDFNKIYDACIASGAGEPGIYWTNDYDLGTNPCCLPGDNIVIHKDKGQTRLDKIVIGDIIWTGKKWTKVLHVWDKGIQDVYSYYTDCGILNATEDHKILQNGIKIPISQAKSIDSTNGTHEIFNIDYRGKEQVWDIMVEDESHIFWCNNHIVSNCEISLKSRQLCNLTEVVVSNCDNIEDFRKAVYAATILGTFQASFTNFGYIHSDWSRNCKEEALLGVSLTGQAMKWELLENDLKELAQYMKVINAGVAEQIGINKAARVGAIKPSGSASSVMDCSPGIHATHAEYYLRRVRISKLDPLAQYLISVLPSDFIEYNVNEPSDVIIGLPVHREGFNRHNETSLELLERVKYIKSNWIDPSHHKGKNTHNVSVTVNYKPDEIESIKKWMWSYREFYNGISLLPMFDNTYDYAPYEDISKERYEELNSLLPEINLSSIVYKPSDDGRSDSNACEGGLCAIN